MDLHACIVGHAYVHTTILYHHSCGGKDTTCRLWNVRCANPAICAHSCLHGPFHFLLGSGSAVHTHTLLKENLKDYGYSQFSRKIMRSIVEKATYKDKHACKPAGKSALLLLLKQLFFTFTQSDVLVYPLLKCSGEAERCGER